MGIKRTQKEELLPKPNSVEAVLTTVTTAATKIELPELAQDIVVYHNSAGATLFYGLDSSITTSTDSAPLGYGGALVLELRRGNDNNLWGIVASGSLTVYAVGSY